MADVRKFELVEEPETQIESPTTERIAHDAILLALKTLSQKTIVALSNLFCLLTVGSAFVLWFHVPDPNVFQIVSLGLYAVFILAANWIVRRR